MNTPCVQWFKPKTVSFHPLHMECIMPAQAGFDLSPAERRALRTRPEQVRMRSKSFGFARIAAATFWTKAQDVEGNLAKHLAMARRADAEKIQAMAFPELGLSGYGCQKAFTERELQISSLEALRDFCAETAEINTVFFLGLPLALNRVFNVAAVVHKGKVIAFIPKTLLASRGEWQEGDWFSPASELNELNVTEVQLEWQDAPVPIGTDIIIPVYDERGQIAFVAGVEICEDGWQANSPGDRHAHNGATVIINLSASNWVLGKDQWRLVQFPANSGRQKSAFVYVTMAGDSGASVVWDGQCFIVEDGTKLSETNRWLLPYESELIVSDVDIEKLLHDRHADGGWGEAARLNKFAYRRIAVTARNYTPDINDFRRPLTRLPFVPKDPAVMQKVGTELFQALAQGVIARLTHISKDGKPMHVNMGLSGGLDSALAFLIACYAYDRPGWDRTFIHAARLPGPGSTKRTQANSLKLARVMRTSVFTKNITRLATEAIRSTGHEPCWNCELCENAQARARTFILKTHGFNLGTGDMSEAAKGWCTEGGDQSSHFHVIANIPKTLVKYLVKFYIEFLAEAKAKKPLLDILATKISPELRKLAPGEIQESESLMGPYDLTDFYMFHMLRTGAEPERIAFLAEVAFSRVEREGDVIYDRATILKWLRDYYWKFGFAQFKRNASPDSVLVASLGLGAHAKFRWPSDGSMRIWMRSVERLITELPSAA